jgi:hypothetical protein
VTAVVDYELFAQESCGKVLPILRESFYSVETVASQQVDLPAVHDLRDPA